MNNKERLLVIYNKIQKWKQVRPTNDIYTPEQVRLLQETNNLIKEYNKSSKKTLELISLKDTSKILVEKSQKIEAMIADSVVHV